MKRKYLELYFPLFVLLEFFLKEMNAGNALFYTHSLMLYFSSLFQMSIQLMISLRGKCVGFLKNGPVMKIVFKRVCCWYFSSVKVGAILSFGIIFYSCVHVYY